MFRKFLLTCFAAALFSGCNEKKEQPNSDIEAAHTFIKYIQENNFEAAESVILNDQENKESLIKLKKAAENKSAAELEKYKNADIIIDELSPVNDSVTIVHYAISNNKEQKNKLKLIRRNGQWLVDLKYTFSGNL